MISTPQAKAPLYQHVADDMRREIEGGRFQPGSQVPTEGALCEQYRVSRITIRRALELLANEGLLKREQGRGTFVAEGRVDHSLIRMTDFIEDMADAGLVPSSTLLEWVDQEADEEIAGVLRLQPGARVSRLERMRSANDQPIAVDVTYMPLRFSRLLDRERLDTTTIYGQLEADYGIPITSGSFIIEADIASPRIAEQLLVPVGSPVLVIRRTSFTSNDEAIYFQVRAYRADRVRFRAQLHREHLTQAGRMTEFVPDFHGLD